MEHVNHLLPIENQIARVDSAIKHLTDARKGLEKHLFDRVPSGRLDQLYNEIALSIDLAMQNLSEV